MITLNEIAYNIKNLAYGGKNSTENNISTEQIKHWVHYHRAKLIADNANKGITNNQALYQDIALTARNSTNLQIRNFYDKWDQHDIDSNVAIPTINEELIKNLPKTGSSNNRLNGEWLALSSISQDTTGDLQSWNDAQNRSFYGDETQSSQLRGDFRNLGGHSFYIPKPLQLMNDESIKQVRIQRFAHFPDDPGTGDNEESTSYAKQPIQLYRKEFLNFDDYNKFTDRSQPYYTQQTSQAGYQEKHGMETNYISLRGLQVSPNYHGGLASPGEKKIFWKYRATMSAILENPTEIKSMWRLWIHPKPSYDDFVDSYPIPMEYVSDLIQRVVQVEMQTELQTQSDVINDGLDDNIRRRGSQVQK